ncbi:hypothetical protein H663_019775 [Limnohabitans planktonicus II-D5]|uniref:Uncharacterized protein n=1 Tax=Limnohabitans planktonicus II-D5 TaxID=1293045 RepID=A0A2T7U8F1_9BURK|nr:hypothetical protein H663_019775 [Limnohabitans planktonicus II-D5]
MTGAVIARSLRRGNPASALVHTLDRRAALAMTGRQSLRGACDVAIQLRRLFTHWIVALRSRRRGTVIARSLRRGNPASALFHTLDRRAALAMTGEADIDEVQ